MTFDDFWQLYPRKKAKPDARKAWAQMNCDVHAEEILAHVQASIERDVQWQDKRFIPYPATYLRGERWQDEIDDETYQPDRLQARADAFYEANGGRGYTTSHSAAVETHGGNVRHFQSRKHSR